MKEAFSCTPIHTIKLPEGLEEIQECVFEWSEISAITIPGSVRAIKAGAFYNCTTLASVRFEACTTPLTIGFQPGTNEHDPLYQSPLTSIYVNRELIASESYAAARDQDDEGIFSSTLSDDYTTTVTLQGNVNTISDYMFSGVPIETIWIPREVTTICKGTRNWAYYAYIIKAQIKIKYRE